MKKKMYIFFILLIFYYGVGSAQDLYPFKSSYDQLRFQHLLGQFRCVVCQNQNLLDSNAVVAQDLRTEIYTKMRSGQKDEEIKQYLIERYGQYILYNPPFNRITYALWLGPYLILFIAFIIIGRIIRKHRAEKILMSSEE